jgi:hypothetical protein
LIENFYRSVAQDLPPPISYREILLTAKIMDEIFIQLNEKRSTDVSSQAALHGA